LHAKACSAACKKKLYAQERLALLVSFTPGRAGKDGVIKHVMSGVNPPGCDVHAFKYEQ